MAWGQVCDQEKFANLPTERFVLHDDGTATDRVTGLNWQRCAVGQRWTGATCEDEGIKAQIRSWFSWDDALGEVQRLQSRVEYRGWRLPTVQELRTLIDRRCNDPSTNLEVFPRAPAWPFWTATSYRDNLDYAWQIDFRNGEVNSHLKATTSYHIRMVKGSALPLNRKAVTLNEDKARLLKRWDDGVHDVDNTDLSLLQYPQDVLKGFPRDTRDRVDWAKALLEEQIQPRVTREGGGEMVVWDQDILFKQTATMPHVLFPHKLHSMWLACDNCHDQIFPARSGATEISMASIYQGEQCGVCHGKVAFEPTACERCHSVLHEGSPVKWW
jgi:c(7)-type cytochrome triheme protein